MMPAGAELAERPLRGAIFDLGGVMTEPFFRGLRLEPGLDALLDLFLEEARDVYHLPTGAHDLHLLELGEISEREFFSRLCRRHAARGHDPVDPDVALHAVWGREMVRCAAMVDAVRQVRAAGCRTALLTNISRGAEPVWRALFPVDELFDVVVDSSVVKLRKPDPEIFRLTCRRLGLGPDECLFVDDLACNTEAAAALGMATIRCEDPLAAADEVTRRLLGRPVAAEPEPPGSAMTEPEPRALP